jgi:amino acid transporter
MIVMSFFVAVVRLFVVVVVVIFVVVVVVIVVVSFLAMRKRRAVPRVVRKKKTFLLRLLFLSFLLLVFWFAFLSSRSFSVCLSLCLSFSCLDDDDVTRSGDVRSYVAMAIVGVLRMLKYTQREEREKASTRRILALRIDKRTFVDAL